MGGCSVRVSFDQLKTYLDMGHEIEFFFQSRRYSITNVSDGWILSEFYGDYQTFSDPTELLDRAVIDGSKLEQIWGLVDVDIIF